MTDDFSALEEATMRIDELEYELSDAELKIQRVRELHKPVKETYGNELVCDECIEAAGWNVMESKYPCDTIKALDGEQ